MALDEEIRVQTDDSDIEVSTAESAAPAPDPVSSTEASSSGNTGEPKSSLLDAVLEVVKPTSEDGETVEPEAEKPEAPTSEQPEEEDQAGQADKEKSEKTAEEIDEKEKEGLSAPIRKRVDRLLKDRRELRREVENLKPVADIGAELQNFAVQHQLSSDDVVNALHIAATLRRGDYKTFYEMLSPYVRHAQEYLGVVLPDDLAAAVHQGQITEDYARQYARSRFDQQRTQIENQRMGELGQEYFVRQVQGNVQRAVYDFENQLSARDPDYKAKAGLVQRAAGAILRERGGSISSPEEAVSVVKQAYDEVNAHVRKFAAQPRATHPSPSGTNSQTPSARISPKNLMEAAMQGLAKSRAG